MTLCLFDAAGAETQIPLLDYDAGVWHGFVPGVGAGQAYGYRAAGPLRPGPGRALQSGQAAARPVCAGDHGTGHASGRRCSGTGRRSRRRAEQAGLGGAGAPQPGRGRHASPGATARARHRYADTVIYEVHVKGFTMRHPGCRPELRGTYAGLGHEAAIGHLRRPRRHRSRAAARARKRARGVPARARADELLGLQHDRLLRAAPGTTRPRSRAGRPGGQVAEFKGMVDALHDAGLEVLLDVVFNHTAEGDQLGPTLCFRGLDNAAYYRLEPARPSPLRRHHRLRQLAQRRGPADAAADHGLAALLADRDAGRRLPVRPRSHAGPPGRRVRDEVGVLRPGRRRTRSCPGPS